MTANQSIIGQLGKDILDLGTKELAIFLSVTSIILILAASINKSEGFQKFVGSPTGAINFAIKIFTICIFGTFLHGLYLHYNSLPDAVCQYTVNPIFNLVLFSVGVTLLLLGTGFSIPSYYAVVALVTPKYHQNQIQGFINLITQIGMTIGYFYGGYSYHLLCYLGTRILSVPLLSFYIWLLFKYRKELEPQNYQRYSTLGRVKKAVITVQDLNNNEAILLTNKEIS